MNHFHSSTLALLVKATFSLLDDLINSAYASKGMAERCVFSLNKLVITWSDMTTHSTNVDPTDVSLLLLSEQMCRTSRAVKDTQDNLSLANEAVDDALLFLHSILPSLQQPHNLLLADLNEVLSVMNDLYETALEAESWCGWSLEICNKAESTAEHLKLSHRISEEVKRSQQ